MTQPGVPSSRLHSLIPVNPSVLASVRRLLAFIDELPPGATGAMHFPDQGVILLQSRKILWAMARGTRLRLTDILRHQTTPPLTRDAVEAVYRRCRENGTPIGEALVASGLASEAGLRAALAKHNGEAIAVLARAGAPPQAFVKHGRNHYDPRFSFSPSEVLASLGALEDPAGAAAAQQELTNMLVPESTGAAFSRSSAASGVVLIAADRNCDVAVRDLLEVCGWAAGLLDIAHTFDPRVLVGRVAWGSQASIVTWRFKDVGYVGLCSSRAAAARLVSRLAERLQRPSGVMPVETRRAGEGA